MKKIKFYLLFAILLMVISACQSNPDSTTKKTESSYSFEALNPENESDFSFKTIDIHGNTVQSVSNKPTAIFFLASWCPTCIPGEKILAELQKKVGEDVQLITVDIDPDTDTVEDLANFQKKHGGEWPHILDETREMTKFFGITYLEEVIILNEKGEITFRDFNPPLKKLEEKIAEAKLEKKS